MSFNIVSILKSSSLPKELTLENIYNYASELSSIEGDNFSFDDLVHFINNRNTPKDPDEPVYTVLMMIGSFLIQLLPKRSFLIIMISIFIKGIIIVLVPAIMPSSYVAIVFIIIMVALQNAVTFHIPLLLFIGLMSVKGPLIYSFFLMVVQIVPSKLLIGVINPTLLLITIPILIFHQMMNIFLMMTKLIVDWFIIISIIGFN